MEATVPGRWGSRYDALSWISLGMLAAACVLWLAFTPTDRIASAVFELRPGQPYRDPAEPMRLYLAIVALRCGGVVVAASLVVGGVLLRKQPLDGRSPAAWLNLAGTLLTVLVAMVIARELRGRPVTPDLWIVFAGVAATPVAAFWRARRRSSPPREAP